MDTITKLSTWYETQCVSDWHEDHGIKIDTLDNPGWSFTVDLKGTPLSNLSFEEVRLERTESDWITARTKENVFEAFGGPQSLKEMIELFLCWADRRD